MKKYVEKCIAILIIEVLLLILGNVIINASKNDEEARDYRVSAKRIEDRLKKGESASEIDLSEYASIVSLGKYEPGKYIEDDYLIISVDNKEGGELTHELYYVSYVSSASNTKAIMWFNIICLAMVLVSVGAFVFIGRSVIKPFHDIRELPYELSKGNLSVPVKENKDKVFGRFLWGMDLLRENLEESKEEELRLQKEKKTLLLSISHDIKTPLSSIKLYSKALEEELYEDEAKKREVYKGISKNASDIENYVNQIIKASKEDILHLQAKDEKFYLSDVIKNIDELYRDKLEPLKTDWIVGEFDNCMLSGDKERLIEVIQNIIENAIKYGDGGFIKMTVDEEEECKLIRIENSGKKIKSDELPHIFDSFYRGSNVGNKKGSGLGLYICRTLMQLMDGDVYVETTAEGNAFTVVVRKA